MELNLVKHKKQKRNGKQVKHQINTCMFIIMAFCLICNPNTTVQVDNEINDIEEENYGLSQAIWATFNLTNNC